MTGPAHIVLLRHGQTELSRAGVFASRTDVPLNEVGRDAARAWSACFADTPLQVASSPRVRAVETATLAGLDASIWDDLSEWDLGDLEGLSADDYRHAHPEWNLFADGPPNGSGESTQEVMVRATRVRDRLLDLGESDGLVLVGHGQFARVVVTQLLGIEVALGRRLSWGPARACMLSWRSSTHGYALAGWNRKPEVWGALVSGNS